MIRCITIGSSTVQGTFVRMLPGGRAEVRVGAKVYAGKMVMRVAADEIYRLRAKQGIHPQEEG